MKTTTHLPHLTNAQMDELLFSNQAEQTVPHLATCPQCTAELAGLRAAFGDLRLATAAAAEHHHRRSVMPAAAHRTPRFAWATVAFATLALAVTPVALHYRAAPVSPDNGVAVVQQPPPVTTLSDEVLFASVQDDLDASVPEPMLALSTTSTTTASTTSAPTSK